MARLVKKNSAKKLHQPLSQLEVQEISSEDPRVWQALRESRLDPYEVLSFVN